MRSASVIKNPVDLHRSSDQSHLRKPFSNVLLSPFAQKLIAQGFNAVAVFGGLFKF